MMNNLPILFNLLHELTLGINYERDGWMDGWPAMETDAGRAVMKTPATKAKDLFKVVLPTPVATTLSISRAVDNHLATKYSK